MSVTVTLQSTSDDVIVTLISTALLESGDDDMPQPTTATPIAAAAVATTLNATGSGYLFGIVVTAPGTAQVQIRSGSSTGTILAVIAANAPVGDVPLVGGSRPYGGGLWVGSGAGSPAFTLLYS